MPHHPHHGHGEPHPQHVVLELGDGIGALIVYTDPELLGTEVEISPAADDSRRSHREVLRRAAGGGESHALVFDNLPAGATRSGSPMSRERGTSGSRAERSPSSTGAGRTSPSPPEQCREVRPHPRRAQAGAPNSRGGQIHPVQRRKLLGIWAREISPRRRGPRELRSPLPGAL